MQRAPLLVIDTPWLLYRSFFALPKSILGRDDEPVNALLGTVNAILWVIDACSPRAVVCCFGAEEAVYRVELYHAYHAHRDPMPAALRAQWLRAPALLAAFGWSIAEHDTLEADDLLWSLARAEREAGGQTLILTADRDLYQAVDEHTAVLELRRDATPLALGPEQVRERLGVEPRQVADLIALRGDPSDGIPGARGIGAKTAAKLLRDHGTLEGVLAGLDAISPRLATALREDRELLERFKQIATLVHVPVELPPDRQTNRAGGAQAAREQGMKQLAARLE